MLMVNFLIDERRVPPKNVCNLCSGNVNVRRPEIRINPQLSVFFSLSHFLSSKIPQSNRPSRKRLQISNRLKRTDNPKTFKVLNSQPRENRILISYSCYLLLVFELPVASVNSCWYVHINKWGSLRIQFKSTFSIKYIAKIASGLGPVTAMIFVLISFR